MSSPSRSLGGVAHLSRRFFWSIRSPAPDADDEAFLLALLTPAERTLYERQRGIDRAHSVRCAVAIRDELGSEATDEIVASALHDVGKTDADLGTLGRVLATVVGKLVPSDRVEAWRGRSGLPGRVATYCSHEAIGADLLRAAGSSPLAVTWAAEHHLELDQMSIEPPLAEALHRADR